MPTPGSHLVSLFQYYAFFVVSGSALSLSILKMLLTQQGWPGQHEAHALTSAFLDLPLSLSWLPGLLSVTINLQWKLKSQNAPFFLLFILAWLQVPILQKSPFSSKTQKQICILLATNRTHIHKYHGKTNSTEGQFTFKITLPICHWLNLKAALLKMYKLCLIKKEEWKPNSFTFKEFVPWFVT